MPLIAATEAERARIAVAVWLYGQLRWRLRRLPQGDNDGAGARAPVCSSCRLDRSFCLACQPRRGDCRRGWLCGQLLWRFRRLPQGDNDGEPPVAPAGSTDLSVWLANPVVAPHAGSRFSLPPELSHRHRAAARTCALLLRRRLSQLV